MSDPKVLVELAIAAPAAEVWEALRDPVQINRWFGWDAPTLADEIQYIFVDHAKTRDHTLYFEGMPDSFEVIDQGDHCLVRLIRAGAAGDDSDWDGANEDMTEGWLAFLVQLRFYMERHRGEERRTVYLSGGPVDGSTTLPRAFLGVDSLANSPPGARYTLTLPNGEALTGTIWATSRRQVALTADAYGDGLVLVTDRSAANNPPVGNGSVNVTTYGLSPEAFASLEDRWTKLWTPVFPPKT